MEITMKEMLKSRGWTLERMAAELCCSISQVSKIQNGNVLISRNMQQKFQSVFPNFTLINSAERWKEKYQELEAKYNKLLEEAFAMQNELNDHKLIFEKIGKTLLEIGGACNLNSQNVNEYEIPTIPKRKSRKIELN